MRSELEWDFLLVAARALADKMPAAESWSAVYARAGYLLCAVERDNKSRIEEIVGAASKAHDRCVCGEERTARGGDLHCGGDCDHFAHGEEGECHAFVPAFDHSEFFRRLAREMIGEPVSWFTEHERFTLPATSCGRRSHDAEHHVVLGCGRYYISGGQQIRCNCTDPQFARPFVVPRIKFGEGEVSGHLAYAGRHVGCGGRVLQEGCGDQCRCAFLRCVQCRAYVSEAVAADAGPVSAWLYAHAGHDVRIVSTRGHDHAIWRCVECSATVEFERGKRLEIETPAPQSR